MSEDGDAGDKLHAEDQQEQRDQPELIALLARRGLAGQDGSHGRGRESDPDDAHHQGRIPDIGAGHEGEERDRQRVDERHQGGGRPDLPDDGRPPLRHPARGHRQGDEQKAGQRGRGAGDRRQKIPESPCRHCATIPAGRDAHGDGQGGGGRVQDPGGFSRATP
ncbi:MAG: hypothetical protein ABSD40_03725 [Streptosporangiaceae bacterium]